jgi:hypothetical protein
LIRSLQASLLVLPIITFAGCGSHDDSRASVTGTVKMNNEPIKQGTISFIPEEKGPTAGSVIRDGQYSIPQEVGAFVGKNRVEIRSVQETGRKIKNPYGDNEIIEALESIPHRYNLKTELTANIEQGKENVANFDLESEKRK